MRRLNTEIFVYCKMGKQHGRARFLLVLNTFSLRFANCPLLKQSFLRKCCGPFKMREIYFNFDTGFQQSVILIPPRKLYHSLKRKKNLDLSNKGVCVCTYVYVQLCICVHMWACVYVFVYSCVFICICMFICVFVCIHLCMSLCLGVCNIQGFWNWLFP